MSIAVGVHHESGLRQRLRSAVLLSALVALGFAATARSGAAFVPLSVVPQAQHINFGRLNLTSLYDAQIAVPNDGKVFGLGVGPHAVSRVLRKAGKPGDRITLSVNVLLVRNGKRNILIDTGLGPRYHGHLLASLALTGVSPSAVTDILITHPHPDHIGGLLDADGHLAFPNATIRMSSAAWAWMKTRVDPATVRVVATRVRTFEAGAQVAPDITAVALPGHTPGHVGYEIVSGGARLMDLGDLAHSSIVSLAEPRWQVGFDADRALARETRLRWLAAIAKRHERVFLPHFPFPGVGYIEAGGTGFIWEPSLP